MMLPELTRIMAHGLNQSTYQDSLADNVAGKRSKTNKDKTNRYLKQLYSFDLSDSSFLAFQWFWQHSPDSTHPLLALLYAIRNDFLLAGSIDVVILAPITQKVPVGDFETDLENRHHGRYSSNTLRSIAQNLAASWKQAGFIEGKVKNIRVRPEIGYHAISFALLLAYLEGMRGEFLITSNYIRALCLPESKVRELIGEASKRDILQYQYSGHVTSIVFPHLLKLIGIDGE